MTTPTPGWPPEFQRFFDQMEALVRKADLLEKERQIDAALAAYKACFDLAQRERAPLHIHHLTHIWMGVGFCYADRNDYKSALQMYQLVEKALQSFATTRATGGPAPEAQAWTRFLPPGVITIITDDYDPVRGLATLSESIALAHDNLDQPTQAQAYYERAIQGHLNVGDNAGAARIYQYIAHHSRRREDWPNLKLAGEGLLEMATQANDPALQIFAWQCLAQAAVNELNVLGAIEYLELAVQAEKQTRSLELERDQKLLDELIAGTSRSLCKRAAAPAPTPDSKFDPAKLAKPETLFTKISWRKVTERGGPELQFVLHTKRFEEAAQALRLFHLSVLSVNIKFMRENVAGADSAFPKGVDLMLDWSLADPYPALKMNRLVIARQQLEEMASLNERDWRFHILLEEESGLFGKARQWALPRAYAPYFIDWSGVEGVAVYVRSGWGEDVGPDYLNRLIELIDSRLNGRGPTTGLYTQKGFIYRVTGDWGAAIECYLEEIRLGLRPDGTPGLGALTAINNLGTLYKKQKEFEKARACYQLALHLNPNYFEPLVSLPGVLDDNGLMFVCLGRAYRIRRDDDFFANMLQNMGTPYPHTLRAAAKFVQDIAAATDLSQPLPELAVKDAPALTQTVLGSTPLLAPTGTLFALEDVARVLRHFAGIVGVPARVTLEEMLEFTDRRQSTVQCAIMPLNPKQLFQLKLDSEGCKISVMEELQLKGVKEVGQLVTLTETVPAHAEAVLDLLNSWLARGLLVKDGQQLRFLKPQA